MEVGSSAQIGHFVCSCMMGVVLAVFYDFFRAVRVSFQVSKKHVFLQDLLYFTVSSIVTFIFILSINSGQIRFYIIAGEMIGFLTYYLTLSRLSMKVLILCVKLCKKVLHMIDILVRKPLIKVFGKLFDFFKTKKITAKQTKMSD